MAETCFTDGTASTWMLMPDGSKRGLGYPVEYNLRVTATNPVKVLTPAQVAQIPDYVPPATTTSAKDQTARDMASAAGQVAASVQVQLDITKDHLKEAGT